jgi:hypothetical protein
MAPVAALVIGLLIMYAAATGRIEGIWKGLTGPGKK